MILKLLLNNYGIYYENNNFGVLNQWGKVVIIEI